MVTMVHLAASPHPPDSPTHLPSPRPSETHGSASALAGRSPVLRSWPSVCRGSPGRRISPNPSPPPSDSLRPYTAVPSPPPDAPSVRAETHSCDRKTSGPTCLAAPASPPAGRTDPALLGCQAFAPLRPALGFPPASPVAVYRPRSTTVLGWLASAVAGTPPNREPSCRPRPGFPCWP